MKLGQAAKQTQGSFGIPPEMHPDRMIPPQQGRQQDSAEDDDGGTPAQSADSGFDVGDEDEDEVDAAPAEASDTAPKSPRKILAEMGVNLTGQDWSDYYYKGYMEKKVLVSEIPDDDGTLKPFHVTFRTVIAAHGDMADSLLAEEVDAGKMTIDGVGTRREMWNLAFAVQKLNGMPICKDVRITDPKTKEVSVDLMATVREKRKILSQMAPMVLDRIRSKYWTMVTQVSRLMENPKNNFLD